MLCSACTDNKAPLRYTQFQPARVCHLCFSLLLDLHGQDPDLRHKFRQGRKVSVPARSEAEMTGQLGVRLAGGGQWSRAWCRLHQGSLQTYAGQEDTQPSDTFNMADFTSVAAQGEADNVFVLSGPGELQLHFMADSQEERNDWLEALGHFMATSNTSNTSNTS